MISLPVHCDAAEAVSWQVAGHNIAIQRGGAEARSHRTITGCILRPRPSGPLWRSGVPAPQRRAISVAVRW